MLHIALKKSTHNVYDFNVSPNMTVYLDCKFFLAFMRTGTLISTLTGLPYQHNSPKIRSLGELFHEHFSSCAQFKSPL